MAIAKMKFGQLHYHVNIKFESQGWEVEFVSIGSNKLQNWNDSEIKTWIDSKPKTDIVLFMDWGRFDSSLLDKNLVGDILGTRQWR